MFEYILGKLEDINPTSAIVETGGMGYFINISLHTYSQISDKKEIKMFLHQVVREDAHFLYGFADKNERDIFRLLISVSGVGPNTARVMLSSLSPTEIQSAIQNGEVRVLQGVKGIGAKSAQRIIIDLKDKLGNIGSDGEILPVQDNTFVDEAFSALVMLGFQKSAVDKVLRQLMKDKQASTVESLIKLALKKL